MAGVIYSRKRLALALVDAASQDKKQLTQLVKTVVSYLAATKRVTQLSFLIDDIEKEALRRGFALGHVVSAHPLSDEVKKDLIAMIKHETDATQTELSYETDEALIGGLQLTLPGSQLDASVTRQLQQLTGHRA
jgi:F0F1-type ATP synthase delta subunit